MKKKTHFGMLFSSFDRGWLCMSYLQKSHARARADACILESKGVGNAQRLAIYMGNTYA